MKKLVIAASAVALIYSAGWFVVRTQIEDRIAIFEAESKFTMVYSDRAISGFPFAYQVTYSDLVLSGVYSFGEMLDADIAHSTQIPSLQMAASVMDLSTWTGPIPAEFDTKSSLSGGGLTEGQKTEMQQKSLISDGQFSVTISESEYRYEMNAPRFEVNLDVVAGEAQAQNTIIYVFEDYVSNGSGLVSVQDSASSHVQSARRLNVGQKVTENTENSTGNVATSNATIDEFNVTFDGDLTQFVASFSSDGSVAAGVTDIVTPLQITRTITQTAGPQEVQLTYGPDGIILTTDALDIEARSLTESPALPNGGQQIDGSLERVAFTLEAPTTLTSGKRPFAMTLSLQDVMPGEGLIALYDPRGVFDEHGGSLDLAMGGSFTIAPGISGLEDFTKHPAPISNVALQVERAALTALGANVSMTGSAVSDEFGPEAGYARMNITLTGVQVLINQLVRAGILPPQNAGMFVQMLDGLTAPTDVDGQRMSEVIYDSGRLSANGVPLR